MSASVTQYELNGHPGDAVTKVNFSPVNQFELLVSSWDSTIRLFDVLNNQSKMTQTLSGAVLDCCYDSDGSTVYAGGLDRQVYSIQLARNQKLELGSHQNAVSCLAHNAAHQMLVSGSWDQTIMSIDPRASSSMPSTTQVNGKVFALDTMDSSVVLATHTKRIIIYDVRYMNSPIEDRESPFKHQIRAVKINPANTTAFAVSATEGRVAIEHFKQSASLQDGTSAATPEPKKFAFKCHRKGNICYPVNALAFTNQGMLATGGSDRIMSWWDLKKKKKIMSTSPYSAPISSIGFNNTGQVAAIASSFTMEDGEEDATVETNNIIIRFSQA